MARYGVEHETLQFTAETVTSALYGAGHTVSAVAEAFILHRLVQRPVIVPQTASSLGRNMIHEPAPISPPSPSTPFEQLVTNGGLALLFVPLAHMAVHKSLT